MKLSDGTILDNMDFEAFKADIENLKADPHTRNFLSTVKSVEDNGNFEDKDIGLSYLRGVDVIYKIKSGEYLNISFVTADEDKTGDMYKRLTDALWFTRFLRIWK